MLPAAEAEVKPPPIPPTEADLRQIVKQLDWVRKRFLRAQSMVRKGTWEFHIFQALGMAIDQAHPLLRKVRDRYVEEGKKYDIGKVRLGLLPTEPLKMIARVLMHGAQKYGDHNWRQDFQWSRLYDATQRHLFAFLEGEDLDQESGLPHLAHAACELLFLMQMTVSHQQNDDRYKAPAKVEPSENLDYKKIQEEAKKVSEEMAEKMRVAQKQRALVTYEEHLDALRKAGLK